MKRRVAVQKGSSHSGLNLPLSIATFFIGVILTFTVTRVFAQTADTNQIYACVNNTNGNVRIVTSQDTCKNAEKSIKWSIQGPPGPQGPAGSTGGLNQYFGLPFICNSCYLANLGDRFSGKDFQQAHITRSDFTGADLSGVKFTRAFLSSNNFTNTNLTDADFNEILGLPNGQIPQNNNYTNANVTNADFSGSLLHEANFTNANVQGVNFSNAILRRAKFGGAQNMGAANFSGATFEEVTCPDGTITNSSCDGHM